MPDENPHPEMRSVEHQSFLRLTRETGQFAAGASRLRRSKPARRSPPFLCAPESSSSARHLPRLMFLKRRSCARGARWAGVWRWAMCETAVSVFPRRRERSRAIPPAATPVLFQLCSRQMTLSRPQRLKLAQSCSIFPVRIDDPRQLAAALEVASEIARAIGEDTVLNFSRRRRT